MKIIRLDQVTGIASTSTDAAYPVANLQNKFRGVLWKSAVSAITTLTVDISANSNALMLSNMNSGTVTVTVKDSTTAIIYGPTVHTINANNPNLWVNYTLQAAVAEATLVFSDPGTTMPYCGILRAGYAYDFRSFVPGLSEGLKDLSVSKEYNNGADYYEFIDTLRVFSGSFMIDRDTDFYTFMHAIVKKYGRGPYAMFLTDLTNYDWAVFGWLDASLPQGSHDYPNQSNISLSIKEGL
jgi:hypothetical protein